MQQKIDADEAQIRKLNEDNEALKKQADVLTAELSSKGDSQNQHAEQIKQQTEGFQKQLADQQQANQTQINELMAKIKDCDDKMLELQTQLKNKTDEVAAHAQSITDTQNKGESQITQLNEQITQLKSQNEDLTKRIVSATQAIMQATENLENLANSVPNQQSEQYIDKLFQEIEQSIQNISNVIQGKGQPTANGKLNANDTITPINQLNGQPIQVTYSNILGELSKKIKQNAGKQYIDASNELKQPGVTVNDVANILKKNGITFKNGAIMGGKRTKKIENKKEDLHTEQTQREEAYHHLHLHLHLEEINLQEVANKLYFCKHSF